MRHRPPPAGPASRGHESEADALGLQLCARACCDPRKSIEAHTQLAAYETSQGGDPETSGLMATHPATLQRLEDLRAQVPAAVALYESGGCAYKKRALLRALGLVDQ